MFRTRKRLAIGIGALVLVLSSLYFVGTALADTPTATTQQANYREVFIDKLAAALGVDSATLQSKVKDAAKGTVDQAVANGDLAQNQANKIKTAIDNGKGGLLGGLAKLREARVGAAQVAKIEGQIAKVAVKAIADQLGITPAALKRQLRNGQSLDSLAKAKGLTVQDLYDSAADAVRAKLDTAVSNGTIAKARADEIVQAVREGRLTGLNVLPKAPAKPTATPTPSKG